MPSFHLLLLLLRLLSIYAVKNDVTDTMAPSCCRCSAVQCSVYYSNPSYKE
jgi:hypothetical protein